MYKRQVLTIHNIGYQGVFAASAVADLGVGARIDRLHQDDLRAGHINALKHGIMYADAITTVSPTYAAEICTAEYGMGLQDALRARGAALSGILNGADYDEWDPRRDRYLPSHYDAAHLQNKAALKQAFLARCKISVGARAPLVGFVSRMATQLSLIHILYIACPVSCSAPRRPENRSLASKRVVTRISPGTPSVNG